jgi:hypothetical protein
LSRTEINSNIPPSMTTIVVRNRRNRSRFIGQRGWIHGERRARKFPSIHAAIVLCHDLGIDDAEVIVRFGEPRTADVAINLPTEISSGASSTEQWTEFAHAMA